MNANELADQLERDVKDFFPIPDEICLTAATMLRKQQKEIEALKTELKLIDELVTGKAQEK
jgi:hypothetical protein